MKIDRIFLYFKSYDAFQRAYANEEIKDDSIVFIEDKHAIWTHGVMFGIENSHAKGFFSSIDDLPSGEAGDWAIVKNDGAWYIYYYNSANNTWEQGEEYDMDPDIDLSEVFVKKEDVLDYIKRYYDNVYVRKDEVYTPDQWEGAAGDDSHDSGGGNNGGGNNHSVIWNVDSELNNHSINPVSNWVIYYALQSKLDTDTLETLLDDYVSHRDLPQEILQNSDLMANINNPIRLYIQNNVYTQAQIDRMLSQVQQLSIKAVDSLNEVTNPDTHTIYLVRENNSYTQYVYSEGQWSAIGTYDLGANFSDYYTKDEINERLQALANSADYYTKQYIDTRFQNVTDLFSNYYTKQQIDQTVVKKQQLYTPQSGPVLNNAGSDTHSTGTSNTPKHQIEASDSNVSIPIDDNTFLGWPKYIIMTQSQYDKLQSYVQDAIYFIIDMEQEPEQHETTTWTFGGTFPITFTNGDTPDSIGTFPINLA